MTGLLLLSGGLHLLALLALPLWGRGAGLDEAIEDLLVDVVVPARDEAHNIASCMEAIQASPGTRLVVVDDGSTDGTGDTASRTATSTTTVVPGQALPEGWAGKPWACQQGGARGSAPWILFVDADVRLSPETPRRLATHARRRGLDLLSAYGTWTLGSFWERAAIPAIGWTIRAWADPARVNSGKLAFANGQCLLIRRSTWESLGGHGAVAASVLDDVGMAGAVRARGGRVGLVFAPEAFSVRLYRGLGELVRGYGKNLLVGLGGRRWLALLGALAVWAFAVLPWGVLVAQVIKGGHVVLPATVCVLTATHRAALERRGGGTALAGLLQPFGAAVLGWVLLVASLGREVSWRGRRFSDGSAAAEPQE